MMIRNIAYLLILSCCFYSICNAQPLTDLMQEAVEHNPALQAIQLEYESMLKKAEQQNQLPDPQIGLGVPVLRPETRLGAQVVSISAQQMFPWFGSLGAKEDVVLTMAKSKYETLSIEKLKLFYLLKTSYYQLYLINEKQKIIVDNIRLFNTLESVSLSKIESGKSIASDVLKIKLKTRELENSLHVLENYKSDYQTAINQIMNRSLEDSIQILDTFDSIAILDYNINDYQSIVEQFHPAIKQLDWEIEAADKEKQLNKLQGLPSFGVGLDYSAVAKRTDALPMNNGRDILIPKVMVTIPINRKKYAAKNQEETLKQEAIKFRKESIVDEIITQLQQLKTQYDNSVLEIELLNEQIIIANSAFNILLSEYSGKGTRFDELIGILNQLFNYEIGILNASVNTHEIVAGIDRYTHF